MPCHAMPMPMPIGVENMQCPPCPLRSELSTLDSLGKCSSCSQKGGGREGAFDVQQVVSSECRDSCTCTYLPKYVPKAGS